MKVIISSPVQVNVDGPTVMIKRLTRKAMEMKTYPGLGFHKEPGFKPQCEFWLSDQAERDGKISWWVRYTSTYGPLISRHCNDEFELLVGVGSVVHFAWEHAQH
jgi:hypothetical protein